MRAVRWHGKTDVRVDEVTQPTIINPRDAIIKVTLTAICGSDLHLYDGVIPTMQSGDILGHEFMGEIVETGPGVTNLRPGDRVVIPFPIACGNCWYCRQGLTSLCDNSNPNGEMTEKLYGASTSGIYGYSHLYGGYPGGQAEYVRVPFADFCAYKLPDGLPDDKFLFLGDIFPTGWMAAENCGISPGDTVAVWGCGPVGLFAMKSARLMGAERVIGLDKRPERLKLARDECGAHTINFEQEEVFERLRELTGGRGPDSCIDAVGMEADATGVEKTYDAVKQALRLESDRPSALRQAIRACRKGGIVSVPGVYGGFADKVPLGAFFGKALTMRGGQTHVHRYLPKLVDLIVEGRIDPSFIITHRLPLDEAPLGYDIFKHKQDGCIKVVLTP